MTNSEKTRSLAREQSSGEAVPGFKTKGRSTLFHLFVASVVAFLPSLIITGVLLYRFSSSETERLSMDAVLKAKSVSSVVEQEVTKLVLATELVASSPKFARGDFEGVRNWLADGVLNRHGIVRGVIALPDGQQIMNLISGTTPRKGSPEGIELDRRAVEQGTTVVSDVFLGATAEEHIVVASTPTKCGNQEVCLVKFATRASELAKVIVAEGFPPGWFATLVDNNYRIIARSHGHNDYVGKSLSERAKTQLIRDNRPDFAVVTGANLEGLPTITQFQKLDNGWYIAVGLPSSFYSEVNQRSVFNMVSQIFIIFVMSLMMAYFVSHRIVRAIDSLRAQSATVKNPKAVITPLQTPILEVNVVSETLVEAAREKAERDEQIQKNLAHTTVLMRETLHRAKNQLTIILVMARQTARSTKTVTDFVSRFEHRLAGLAQTQALLVDGQWKGVPVENLVRVHLAHYADYIGKRIIMEGPPLSVFPEPAQNLGLALHELSSNATKYGALSNTKGKVRIKWGIEDGKFVMEWIERSGPKVKPPEEQGFGTVMVKRLVAQSFDGKVDLSYEPHGFSWRLEGNADYFYETKSVEPSIAA